MTAANVTGSAQHAPEAAVKRLELLKEAFPNASRVGIVVNPPDATTLLQLRAMQAAARAIKVDLEVVEVTNTEQFEVVFAALARRRVDAVMLPSGSFLRANAGAIVVLATRQGLPVIGQPEIAQAGGVIGYGVDSLRLHRRSGYFIDRILKGAKPSDIPIEQAAKLDLVINLKAAAALNVNVPQTLLVRADEVIR